MKGKERAEGRKVELKVSSGEEAARPRSRTSPVRKGVGADDERYWKCRGGCVRVVELHGGTESGG